MGEPFFALVFPVLAMRVVAPSDLFRSSHSFAFAFPVLAKVHLSGVKAQHKKAAEMDLHLCNEILEDGVVTGLYLVQSSSLQGVCHRVKLIMPMIISFL